MTEEKSSLPAWAGAALGARVGVLIAAGEAVASSWLTRATLDGLDYMPQSAISFGVSIAAHALFGALAGALATLFAVRLALRIERSVREVVTRCATLALVLAVAVNEWSLLDRAALEIRQSLAIALLLATAIVLSLSTRRFAQWLAGLASPWMAALSLGIVPWLAGNLLEYSTWNSKQAVAALLVLGLALVATLGRDRLASARALCIPLVGAVLLLALAGGWLPQATIEMPVTPKLVAKGPNVIMIVLDTVRADRLSVYGHTRDTTPFLREFAKDADVFERFQSAGDFTVTSHASLFSGLYAREHGARPDPDRATSTPLPHDATSLTEILAQQGWRTSAVAANCICLAPEFGMAQGFEHYDSRLRTIDFPRAPRWSLRARLHSLLYEFMPPNEFDLIFRGAGQITQTVCKELDRRDRERPLFLFVNYMDAHVPYLPPAPFDSQYFADGKLPNHRDERDWRAELYQGAVTLPDDVRDNFAAGYDGALAYLDSQLRVLFDRLKQDGLYEDSLIIVTSDHGEAFAEHDTREHDISVYQEQVRVPLLIKRPRAHDGKRIETLASSVDILPTVLAELGLETPPGLPGRALYAADAGLPRMVFSEHFPNSWHVHANPARGIHQTVVVWGNFAVIRRDDGHVERYDLAVDPREEHPLEAFPAEVPDLVAELEQWVAARRSGTPRDRASTLDGLKMLGYTR